MELYYVISILDRPMREKQEKIYHELGLTVDLSMMGRGTATREVLSMLGLTQTEKVVIGTFADRNDMKQLFRKTKEQMYIDIPGNGVMTAIPMKSVGGMRVLSFYLNGKQAEKGTPDMDFKHELIYVILNEGHSDEVMDAARSAGATGGTVLSAKGTGIKQSEKFRELSLTNEKEVIMIVSKASAKAAIMKAIIEKTGLDTPAEAICFSLPVSQVAGLRRMDDDD